MHGVQRLLLRVWRHVPRTLRRWIVRVVAPSFTVGAACVVERDDGAMLLVRLVYREGWGLPGGLIKRNEDVADCARREVLEEIGLPIELAGQPAVVVDSRPQRVDVVFRARTAPGTDPAAVRPRSPEIREVRWFDPGQLPTLQHETVSALGALASSVLGAADVEVGAAPAGLQVAAEAARAQARRRADRRDRDRDPDTGGEGRPAAVS
jgi:8-oxo-dGTP pyrophosphatase MutT (NUDIX family)